MMVIMRRAAPAEPMPMPIFAPVSRPLSSLLLSEGDVEVGVADDVVDGDDDVVVVMPVPSVPAGLDVAAGLKSFVQVMEPPAAVGTVCGDNQLDDTNKRHCAVLGEAFHVRLGTICLV